MNLGQYIKTHRRNNAALTYAEAKVAGLSYPMERGWPKKYFDLEVDELAMVAARAQREARLASNRIKPGEVKKRKKSKKGDSHLLALIASAMPVNATAKAESDAKTDARHAYVNSAAFLASFEWRTVRFAALQNYGRRCQCCGASPESGAVMHVDHVKPRRRFPELALDISNLQVLCDACNHGKCNQIADFR